MKLKIIFAISLAAVLVFPAVNVVLVNPENPSQQSSFPLASTSDILSHADYDTKRPTAVYFMGYTDTMASPTVQAIIDGYATLGGHNIIVVDWSTYCTVAIGYVASIPSMKLIGDSVGRRLFLSFGPALLRKVHFVGHSLGAHMAAYANRVIPLSPLKVSRIVGLDPSGPLMYTAALNHQPLNANDADSVQVIHTDMRFFGAPVVTGSIDFLPNNGGLTSVQPGCPPFVMPLFSPSNFCSTTRSVFLYRESLISSDPDTFLSISCSSCGDFQAGTCSSDMQNMGFKTSESATGTYFLQTNAAFQFSRGLAGTDFSP